MDTFDISVADVEAFIDMAKRMDISSEFKRREQRGKLSMDEIREFYEELQPSIEKLAKHCDMYTYSESIAGDELHLINLLKFYMELAITVEFLREPMPSDLFPANRFMIADVSGF